MLCISIVLKGRTGLRRIWKIAYVLCRQIAIFSFPGLRNVRNFVYNRYLNTSEINVDDFVRVAPAHITNVKTETRIGTALHMSRNSEIDTTGGVIIGARVTVSEGAKIFTHDHIIDGGSSDWRKNGIKHSPLCIEDDVWIGADSIILQSVSRIGKGSIVASGSVVRSDIEDHSIVAGVPAKLIRKRKLDL